MLLQGPVQVPPLASGAPVWRLYRALSCSLWAPHGVHGNIITSVCELPGTATSRSQSSMHGAGAWLTQPPGDALTAKRDFTPVAATDSASRAPKIMAAFMMGLEERQPVQQVNVSFRKGQAAVVKQPAPLRQPRKWPYHA